ncbi:PEP/pyruvate-binding domain-containing protein [Rhodococcus opacus]|uniref:Pyruvate, water dikinase n=2 Tax=Rhodococcus TaxID=1827 RepID=A0A2S8J6A9_RHOOP|nr:PEP/pyruvate-binding domain-containing protein [Rhodococcus opacus]PQP22586.1 pyruvate, water dikinase [Rhodococcus opacus]
MDVIAVMPLEKCGEDVASEVGGKALGLGALMRSGMTVPPGFVVTTDAYRAAVKAAGINEHIESALRGADPEGDLTAVSEVISALFTEALISDELRTTIEDAYRGLGLSPTPVAVRSSAIAEDRADASFAGQQDTYLWVQGADQVITHIVRCWASLFSPRVIAYRARLGVPPEDVAMAVVVQEMVQARAAGVMMTLDPANGDRDALYIESNYGLGEAVVAGEVTPDSFWVDKKTLGLRKRVIGDKQIAYRFDEASQQVRKVEVSPGERADWSLSNEEVCRIAELGREIETAFGAPMDVEWAIAGSGPSSQVQLLQARPETVWASQPVPPVKQSQSGNDSDLTTPQRWDPLHSSSTPNLHWTTSNLGEAMPGVLTPLNWTLWHRTLEKAALKAAFRIGVLSRAESEFTDDADRHYFRVFYGRPTIQVEYMGTMGDRMPGTSSEDIVISILGRVPDGWQANPTRRRWPIIAGRFPWTFMTVTKEIRKTVKAVDAWYAPHLQRVSKALTVAEATENFRVATRHFDRALETQVVGSLAGIVPVYDILERLTKRAGVDISALSGSGGAEVSGLVTDVWKASRNELRFDEVVARHGMHGPSEGEISSVVWRENPEPLRTLIETYSLQDDDEDPRLREADHHIAAGMAARQLLAATPRWQRPAVRFLLKLAATRIPLRGAAKRSLVQGLDGTRASARRLGSLLVEAGTLEHTDDIFYLTAAEVENTPSDVKSLVRKRRERRDAYAALSIPSEWKGMPEATPVGADDGLTAEGAMTLEGIGVSAGVVEGIAHVLYEPDFAAVQPGEVLVTPTTDPSWSSVMFISSALVVDIGGALSHAAVVARELRVPCVVNTRSGSRTIKTGDRIRVNGNSGTVEVLERAASPVELEDA